MFKALVHDVPSDAQRLSLFSGFLTKRVQDEMGCVKSTPDMYWTVLEMLEQTYGLPHLVAQAHLGEMKEKLIAPNDRGALLNFAQRVTGATTVLKDSAYSHELKSGVVLGHLIANLPFHAQQSWSRFQNMIFKKGVVADVNHLSEWLADFAMAERLLLSTKPQEPFVPSTAKPPKFDKTKSSYPPLKTGGAFPPTILATKIEKTAMDKVKPKKKVAFGAPPKLHTPTYSTKGHKPTCFVCSGPHHSLFLCEGWGRLNLAQRIKSINDSNQCQNCCSNGHVAKDCPSELVCRVSGCGAKHHTNLHGCTKAADVKVISTIRVEQHKRPHSVPLLAVVKLNLHFQGRSVTTCALLDDGASGSLIRDDFLPLL